jgi:hypothetical protein
MEHRRDVRGGDLRSGTTSGSGGGQESACGGQGDWALARDSAEDVHFSVPPGYQRQQPIERPKLGPRLAVADAILSDDK